MTSTDRWPGLARQSDPVSKNTSTSAKRSKSKVFECILHQFDLISFCPQVTNELKGAYPVVGAAAMPLEL